MDINNYICPNCNGEGMVEHFDFNGCWKSNCYICRGSGKKSILLTIEEYERLKEKSSKLQRQLNKAIEILGSPSIDICPINYNLNNLSDCPEHKNCQRCWEEGLKTIK